MVIFLGKELGQGSGLVMADFEGEEGAWAEAFRRSGDQLPDQFVTGISAKESDGRVMLDLWRKAARLVPANVREVGNNKIKSPLNLC